MSDVNTQAESRPETVAVIKIDSDGRAVVSGDNIARDREQIIEGLSRALEFLNNHRDD